MYYDSSVHENCPACVNDRLETALFNWAMVDLENLRFETSVFRWIEMFLHAMDSTISQQEKNRSDFEASAAYSKARESQKIISAEYKELARYVTNEDVFSILSVKQIDELSKRMADLCSG